MKDRTLALAVALLFGLALVNELAAGDLRLLPGLALRACWASWLSTGDDRPAWLHRFVAVAST